MLSYTISENHMAFVMGRKINDVILMANEAVDFWKCKKTKGFVIKLDIEKAFDKISWCFKNYMLAKKNYFNNCRKWTQAYIGRLNYSILINLTK